MLGEEERIPRRPVDRKKTVSIERLWQWASVARRDMFMKTARAERCACHRREPWRRVFVCLLTSLCSDFYQLLGVPEGADSTAIESAFETRLRNGGDALGECFADCVCECDLPSECVHPALLQSCLRLRNGIRRPRPESDRCGLLLLFGRRGSVTRLRGRHH